MKNIKGLRVAAIIGMTGCGKSTVGKRAASMLGWEYIDLDREIEANMKTTVRELFDTKGENEFRKIEYEILKELVEKEYESGVLISCGGGAPVYKPTARLLSERTYAIWLRRSPALVMERERVMLRPPINGEPKNYLDLYYRRKEIYRSVASASVYNVAPSKSAAEIVRLICCGN